MSKDQLPDGAQGAVSLDTIEGVSALLAAAFESGDAGMLRDALAAAADAPGTTHLAAFASGELSLDTTLAVMKVIDLHTPG